MLSAMSARQAQYALLWQQPISHPCPSLQIHRQDGIVTRQAISGCRHFHWRHCFAKARSAEYRLELLYMVSVHLSGDAKHSIEMLSPACMTLRYASGLPNGLLAWYACPAPCTHSRICTTVLPAFLRWENRAQMKCCLCKDAHPLFARVPTIPTKWPMGRKISIKVLSHADVAISNRTVGLKGRYVGKWSSETIGLTTLSSRGSLWRCLLHSSVRSPPLHQTDLLVHVSLAPVLVFSQK